MFQHRLIQMNQISANKKKFKISRISSNFCFQSTLFLLNLLFLFSDGLLFLHGVNMHFCQFFFHIFLIQLFDRSHGYYVTTANLYQSKQKTRNLSSWCDFFVFFLIIFFVNSAVRIIIVLGEPLHVVLSQISKVIDVMSYFDILHVLSKFFSDEFWGKPKRIFEFLRIHWFCVT